jgi:paraquat-inducible protein A
MSLSRTKSRVLAILLLIAAALLVAGFVTPMMTITKLVFFSDSFSLLLGIYELYQSEHYFLFVLVGAFSVLLPLFKVLVLFRIVLFSHYHSEKLGRLVYLMHEYGRWAMLDVMVVAILLVTVKLGAIASIEVHSGLYLFGVAVLLIMVITHSVVSHLRTTQRSDTAAQKS